MSLTGDFSRCNALTTVPAEDQVYKYEQAQGVSVLLRGQNRLWKSKGHHFERAVCLQHRGISFIFPLHAYFQSMQIAVWTTSFSTRAGLQLGNQAASDSNCHCVHSCAERVQRTNLKGVGIRRHVCRQVLTVQNAA